MKKCTKIKTVDGIKFALDKQPVVVKMMTPLEFVMRFGFETRRHPTITSILQDYNWTNPNRNSYQKEIQDYVNLYNDNKWFTTWHVYIKTWRGSDDISDYAIVMNLPKDRTLTVRVQNELEVGSMEVYLPWEKYNKIWWVVDYMFDELIANADFKEKAPQELTEEMIRNSLERIPYNEINFCSSEYYWYNKYIDDINKEDQNKEPEQEEPEQEEPKWEKIIWEKLTPEEHLTDVMLWQTSSDSNLTAEDNWDWTVTITVPEWHDINEYSMSDVVIQQQNNINN